MNSAEREGLKEQLRAMAAGRGDGLNLDSQHYWVIEGLESPSDSFHHLHLIIPPGSILYFEGCNVAKEVQYLYEKHKAPNAVPVARDTLFPVPDTFHVSFTPEFLCTLVELWGRYGTTKCFDHVKAYRNEKLLFTFHDAFDGSPCLFSDSISENEIRAFALSLEGQYRLEPNENKRTPEQLQQLLWAMENPGKLKINRPWWKKLLFFWK